MRHDDGNFIGIVRFEEIEPLELTFRLGVVPDGEGRLKFFGVEKACSSCGAIEFVARGEVICEGRCEIRFEGEDGAFDDEVGGFERVIDFEDELGRRLKGREEIFVVGEDGAQERGGGEEEVGGIVFFFESRGGWAETLDDERSSESGFSEIHVERLDGAVRRDAKFAELVGSPSAVGDFDANVDDRCFGLNACKFVVSEGEWRVGLFLEDVGERKVEKAFACAVIEEKRVGEASVPGRETTLFFKMRIEKKMPRVAYDVEIETLRGEGTPLFMTPRFDIRRLRVSVDEIRRRISGDEFAKGRELLRVLRARQRELLQRRGRVCARRRPRGAIESEAPIGGVVASCRKEHATDALRRDEPEKERRKEARKGLG